MKLILILSIIIANLLKNNGIDILIENANFSWGGQMQNNDEPKNKSKIYLIYQILS